MGQSYDLLEYHMQSQPESSSKYFGLSVMLHTALVVASFFVVVPAMENLKNEIITIEIAEVKPLRPPPVLKSLKAPKGAKVRSTRGAQRVMAPAPTAPVMADTTDVLAGPVKKSKTSKSKVAKIKSHTGQGHNKVAKTAVSRAGVPETLEDIPAPDLDLDTVAVAQVGKFGDNEFENEFKNIDRSTEAAVAAQKSELDEETKMIADEKDAALSALSDDASAQAKAMEDALKATRTKNAAALAQLKATERAAAEKAARQAEMVAAAAAKNRGSGNNVAVQGRGNGNEGADKASKTQAGIPNGIRSLDQLKQMPGNPKPHYSNEERLNRHQGSVVFYAYITTAGNPTQFRMVQSTGFRNLDGKTLAALKRWRFYPGQQGWVEIPFKWDLRGGVQEMPTMLRRVGSR
jgi:TonB family protein